MRKESAWRPALAALAATAGVGFASGRETAAFFGQLGWAGWIGIPFAALVFALLTGMLAREAGRSDADSFPALCHRLMGERAANAAGALQALLLAMTCAATLCGAGEAAALSLPLRWGFLWGVVTALLAALLVNLARLRPLPWLGLLAVAAGIALYVGLALDPRPARVYLRGETELALEGSVPAALLLGLACASMNASLAAGAAVRFCRGADPTALGAGCGALFGAAQLCANLALARGGRPLLGQARPAVILAARWGLAGFWCCAALSYLCAVCTLAAALGGLIDLLRQERRRRRAPALAVLAVVLLCLALGLSRALGHTYPAVGWACAAAMALALLGGRRRGTGC